MKILTPEEEAAHDSVTWRGGLLGSLTGLTTGSILIYAASHRYPAFRSLSLPFRAFLLVGTTSFAGVIAADRASRTFEKSRHADADYRNQSETVAEAAKRERGWAERGKVFVSEQRYPIVFGSWVVSMGVALGLVGRSPYLSTQQKLVQARVYAQGLTLAVLVASFALEGNDLRAGKGRWETVKVLDPEDPEHKRVIEKRVHHEAYQGEDQWMDMLETQERRMKERGHSVRSKEKGEGTGEGSVGKPGERSVGKPGTKGGVKEKEKEKN